MLAHSLYHRTLRVSAVLIAAILMFESGLFFPHSEELSLSAHMYVANVIGISASVEPTELNMITRDLTERERNLALREKALSEREIDARAVDATSSSNMSQYILSGILFLLLVLIITNYVLDFLRARSQERITYEAVG